MLRFQPKPVSRPTFEDVFFKHHTRLNEWAMQLTGGYRFDAEDLVQELYIRFAGVGPIGEHIENAEDYLFSALRNLHYARIRRARTSAIDDLSIADYDSAERSLRASDRNGNLFIREELHRVCAYLCERKNTSRAASIFILRYFLGYFPYEVMKVVRSTRVAVDKAIQAARREARLDIERPGVLQQGGSSRDSKPPVLQSPSDSYGLFLALRAQIFRSCTGDCFGSVFFEEKYRESGQNLTTAELAHLVSCPECLDQANRMLGLPLLKERSPDETIGRNTPQGPDGPAGAAPTLVSSRPKRKSRDSQGLRKRMKRRLEEVKQHRPQRLLIAVDGDIRASQKVTAQYSELHAELRPMEKPTFIEVLSEQDVCVAFVIVQAPKPEGSLQQIKEIELSGGRTIKVIVSFICESPAVQIIYNDPLIAQEAELDDDLAEASLLNAPSFASISDAPVPWRVSIAAFLGHVWRRIRRILPLHMNPLLASALLFGLCSILCFLLWTRSGPGISAKTMLSRAEQSDASVSKDDQSGVIYQKVRITASGHTMEHAIYRDPQRKRRFKQQHLNSEEQRFKDKLDKAGVNWDEPLSATTYQDWHDHAQVTRDTVQETDQDLLTLTTSVSNAEITQESLTVRKSDFHPVARSISFRDIGNVEIAELQYATLGWDPIFEQMVENSDSFSPSVHTMAPILPRLPSPEQLDLAELQARLALNRLHADSSIQFEFQRTRTSIEVKGIAESNAQKQQLISALRMLPHVAPAISSIDDLKSQSISTINRHGVKAYSTVVQESPLERFLRAKDESAKELNSISQQLLDAALTINQEGNAIDYLRSRFGDNDQLNDANKKALRQLLDAHVARLTKAVDAEDAVILRLANITPENSDASGGYPLSSAIEMPLTFCKELISGEPAEQRGFDEIALDLLRSTQAVRHSLRILNDSQPDSH